MCKVRSIGVFLLDKITSFCKRETRKKKKKKKVVLA